MGHEGFVSFAPWPKADEQLIDQSIERSHHVVDATVRDIREIQKLLKEQKKDTVHVYIAEQWMFEALDMIRESDVSFVMSDMMKHLMSDPSIRKHGQDVKSIVDRIMKENGLWEYSSGSDEELEALQDSADYISNELGLNVFVHSADAPDYDPENKARFALPGRPSLFLE